MAGLLAAHEGQVFSDSSVWVTLRASLSKLPLPERKSLACNSPLENSAENSSLCPLVLAMALREGTWEGVYTVVQSANCYSISKLLFSNSYTPGLCVVRRCKVK